MTSRSYLSIGDVLTLLRQEFPDVTISKIRFLESQGLVNPERTPSGYRKFYEHDVERLRWVLRQQREHFLPLRVIKDRLDDDVAEPEEGEPSTDAGARQPEAVSGNFASGHRSELGGEDDRRVLVGQGSRADLVVAAGPEGTAVTGPTLPGIEPSLGGGPASSVSISSIPSGPSGGTLPTTSVSAAAEPARSRRTPEPESGGAGGGASGDVVGGGAPPVGSRTSASEPPRRSGPRRGRPQGPQPATGRPNGPDTESGAPPPPSSGEVAARPEATDVGEGTSLSAEELAAASGLELSVIGQLREFGLLTPRNVGGVEYFEEDALAVARLATRFGQFGIEPRHLRLYKNAAEREAGFIEQILLPLVRQRNPEARARAGETADELTSLGQDLRSVLLRRALADLLGR